MNIFTTSPAAKLANFQKQAQNAYSIFTKVLNDLATTNEKISAEVKATEEQIANLISFTQELKGQSTANDKVIGKIKSIIEALAFSLVG